MDNGNMSYMHIIQYKLNIHYFFCIHQATRTWLTCIINNSRERERDRISKLTIFNYTLSVNYLCNTSIYKTIYI